MNIKLELLKNEISDIVTGRLDQLDIDADKIADTEAIKIISEIQQVLLNEDYDDFEIVDEIVEIFYHHNINTGGLHDFG